MITLIITAALLALFTATFIYFLSACLQFFDFVIKGIKGIFKAIKVLILKKNGKVSSTRLGRHIESRLCRS